MKAATLTQARLRDLLEYEPATGQFTWKVSAGRAKSGSRAGCPDSLGYTQIRVDGRIYKTHRLAWLYVHGAFPFGQIDHINQDRGDNRIDNLRDATKAQNMWNVGVVAANTTGFKGVSLIKPTGRYRARIKKDGHEIRLGHFGTAKEAADAYAQAAAELHGEFARIS